MKFIILVTLHSNSSIYIFWSSLFKVQAHVYNVLSHIISLTDEKAQKLIDDTKIFNRDFWNRLDAFMLQWMYSNVSQDILNSITVIN